MIQWNGTSWTSVNNADFDGLPLSAEVFDGDIFVGGSFNHINGYSSASMASYVPMLGSASARGFSAARDMDDFIRLTSRYEAGFLVTYEFYPNTSVPLTLDPFTLDPGLTWSYSTLADFGSQQVSVWFDDEMKIVSRTHSSGSWLTTTNHSDVADEYGLESYGLHGLNR